MYDPETSPFIQLVGNGYLTYRDGTTPSAHPTVNRFDENVRQLILNAFSMSLRGQGGGPDRRRDLRKECGHPDDPISLEDYDREYRRNALANRVVQLWAKEAWQVMPEVREDPDPDVLTPWEEELDDVVANLRTLPGGIPSKFRSDNGSGNVLWSYCRRLTEQSRRGGYGVMLLGFDDVPAAAVSPGSGTTPGEGGETSNPLAEEVVPKDGMRLLYLRVFPEIRAPIATWDTDPNSPRNGMPTSYDLDFGNPEEASTNSGGGQSESSQWTRRVHWTRIIHLAEGLRESEVVGPPALECVFDNVLDHKKLTAASAEMYYRGAMPGWAFETDPALGGGVMVNRQRAQDHVENWFNGLQRYLLLNGMTAKSLAPQVVDPRSQADLQIETVALAIGCPVPVLKGYEIGEQASENNKIDWGKRVKEYQENHLTPNLIVPLIDRLMWAGVIGEPEQYSVVWPDIFGMSAEVKAKVALLMSQALKEYVQGGGENVIGVAKFFSKFMGFSDEDAQMLEDEALDAAAASLEREEESTPEEPEPVLPPGGFGAGGNGPPNGTPPPKPAGATGAGGGNGGRPF